MSQKKEKFFEDILKAREYSYLGMYTEALSHFDVGLEKIKAKLAMVPNDKTLQAEWKFINEEIQEEIAHCKKLRQTIMSGRVDFKEPCRPAVDERRRSI